MASRRSVSDQEFRFFNRELAIIARKVDSGDFYPNLDTLGQILSLIKKALDDSRLNLEHLLFADEEIRQAVACLPCYQSVSEAGQLKMWHRLFPELVNFPPPNSLACSYTNTQGEVIMPNWERVGQGAYHVATQRMLKVLATERKITMTVESPGTLLRGNIRLRSELVSANCRLSSKAIGMRRFCIQYGTKYMRCSARRVLALLDEGECGIGPYEMAAMFVLHPELIPNKPGFAFLCVGCEAKVLGQIDFTQYPHYLTQPDRKEVVLTFRPPNTKSNVFATPTAFFIPWQEVTKTLPAV